LETTTIEVEKGPAGQPTVADVTRTRLWQACGLVSLVALVLVYHGVFQWWWGEWWKEESEYSHGILIPFMSAFVIWFNHKRIAKMPVTPDRWGLALLLPAILLQVIAHRGGVVSVAGLTFPVALTGMSLMLLGKRATAALLFPILFLYFMIVPPTSYLQKLSFQIQMLSTTGAAWGLKHVGLNVVQSGKSIVFAESGQVVTVAAACSGFRLLIALLSFGTFLAYMKSGPVWGKLTLVALVIPLSVALNSLRVFGTALVGEYWGQDAMHAFHDPAGYIMVGIALVVVFFPLSKVVKCRDFKSMPVS